MDQEQLKQHPENARIARIFGRMLVSMHRQPEAIGVYRALLKSVPEDADASLELASLLVSSD